MVSTLLICCFSAFSFCRLVIVDVLGCEDLAFPLVVALAFVLPFWAFVKARPVEVTNDGMYVDVDEIAGVSSSNSLSFA